jgi:EmrB/QacA subfamily drug resistance transporter
MALLATAMLVVTMDVTILNVALQAMQGALGASNGELQWALDSYTITFAAFTFTAGVCADRVGQRATLIGGLLIFGVASVLAALSGGIDAVVAWRAVMGVGAAVIPTTSLAIIMREFPPEHRRIAIAVWASTGGISLVLGPLVGGLLLKAFWWGSVFLVNGPIVLVAVVLAALLVPESRRSPDARFDPIAVTLSMAAIGLVVYGVVVGGQDGHWLDWPVVGAVLAGLLLAWLFVRVEFRRASPAFDVTLFANSRFSAGTAIIALGFFAFMGALYALTFYLQALLGFTPLRAGLEMTPLGVGSLLTAVGAPMASGRFGARWVIAAGSVAMAVSFAVLALLGRQADPVTLAAALLVFGLGWGCIAAPTTAALMAEIPRSAAGAGQAASQTVRQVGAALGVAVIGSVLGAVYSTAFDATAAGFPTDLRLEAAGSIGGTAKALDTVHDRVTRLTPLARSGDPAAAEELDALLTVDKRRADIVARSTDAYLSAKEAALLLAAGVSVAAAATAVRWMPGTSHPAEGRPLERQPQRKLG